MAVPARLLWVLGLKMENPQRAYPETIKAHPESMHDITITYKDCKPITVTVKQQQEAIDFMRANGSMDPVTDAMARIGSAIALMAIVNG